MEYIIHGDKVVITEGIKKHIIDKLQKLNKYFEDPQKIVVHILIKVKNHEQTIEVTIPIKKNTLRAEETHSDLYAAIDLVINKLEVQIKKNKSKLKEKHQKEKINIFAFDAYEQDGEDDRPVVKRKSVDMKPMDEQEAILEMNLLSHDFFVFKDRNTNNVCVLYKRKDGNYGIIETK
jgi:putative sigma-54 modulation protein